MRKKLRCNRCGKYSDSNNKPYHGAVEGIRCSREFVYKELTWSCGGNMYMWEETYKPFDKVVHPNIYNGNEIFTVIEVMQDHLILKGDWSGVGHPEQESTVLKDGWVIHSRVNYHQVLPSDPIEYKDRIQYLKEILDMK